MRHTSALSLNLREDVKVFLSYNTLYSIFGMRKHIGWGSALSKVSESLMFAWCGGRELKEQEHGIKAKQAKL